MSRRIRSPAGAVVGRKARLATLIAVPLAAAIAGVILSGWVTLEDLAQISAWAGRPPRD